MPIDPNKPQATRKDIATYFNVGVSTVDRWLADRAIPFYKCGHAVRFKIAEVEKALRQAHTQNKPSN